MKTKKIQLNLSASSLLLNKETVVELNANQMGGIKGGITNPSDGCHSLDPSACSSFATNCYSACQTGCDYTFGCTIPGTSIDCTGFC